MVVFNEQVFIVAASIAAAPIAMDITKVFVILKLSSCLYKGMEFHTG
jgi:hypothetical protein